MMTPFLRLLPLLLAGLTLTACGPKIRFSDSVDSKFDLRSSWRYDGRLYSPYVAGASFFIYVYDETGNNDLDGWRLESRDPEVLDILEQYVEQDDLDPNDSRKKEDDVLVAKVFAAGEGTVILEVYDDRGEFVRATEVEVMQPDRLELRAAGPLFLNREREVVPSEVDDSPKLLSGGTATFLVEWFKGEQKLNGGGTLSVVTEPTEIETSWVRRTYLGEDRDWLTVTMAAGYSADDEVLTPIEFWANDLPVQTLDFSLVGEDAIAYVDLQGQSEANASKDELLVVLAQAFDESDESIWGVAFDWDLNGRREPGEGDLFRYRFRKGALNTLGAEYKGVRGETQIQGIEGFVDSSNEILPCICTAQPEAPARHIGYGLLGLAALALVRRRRD